MLLCGLAPAVAAVSSARWHDVGGRDVVFTPAGWQHGATRARRHDDQQRLSAAAKEEHGDFCAILLPVGPHSPRRQEE